LLITGVLSYLLGSVSFGIIIPRLMGKTRDVRNEWSGNVGATNVMRVHGLSLGIAVMAADILKGIISAGIGLWLGGIPLGAFGGACVMLGHCYSVFFRFKGGRAVATAAGALLMLFPKAILLILPIFLIIIAISHMVSLASVLSAVTLVVCAFVYGAGWQLAAFCVFASALVIYKHKPNIERIIAGTENKVFMKKA